MISTPAGGTLALANANALAGADNIIFNGGTLQFSASNQVDYFTKIKSSGGNESRHQWTVGQFGRRC